MYKLIIQDDEGKTTVVPLIRDEITIGRKEGNTIRLTERNVSRKHARIVKSNGTVVVEDLESYNGVKVNGTRIQGRVPVGESDRIQIGDYLLELKVDRGAGDSVPPAPGSVGSGAGGGMTAMGSGVGMPAGPAPMQGASTATGNGAAHASGQNLRAPKATQPMTAFAPGAAVHPSSQQPEPPVSGAAAEPGATQHPGRLVVVSSNFAGREFVLDKPSMVIGRTDDNDVVVNHRSISRHHAKIVLEQGRYCVVDMQSSNGVRVNGEDYGKVELRRGDMIDLGHVRMRYVEPGEDFVFARDAQLVDVATRSRGKGVMWAGLSVVLVGAVVAVVVVSQRGGSSQDPGVVASTQAPAPVAASPPRPQPVKPPDPPSTTPAVVPAPAPANADSGSAAPPPPVPSPGPGPGPDKPPTAVSAESLIADAKAAFAEEKWVAALSSADQALKVDPQNAEAKKIQEQATAELRAHASYEKLALARDAGKTAEVARLAREIPPASVYHTRAEADLAQLHDAYVKDRELEAKQMSARGQCDKISGLARRAGEVFPDARAAVEKAGQGCTPIAVRPQVDPGTVAAPATLSEAEVAILLADAKEAARNNNWTEARKKAEEVLRLRPGDQDALSVGGIAACNLSDKERAAKYIDRLKGHRQNMMKQICAAKGVLIE